MKHTTIFIEEYDTSGSRNYPILKIYDGLIDYKPETLFTIKNHNDFDGTYVVVRKDNDVFYDEYIERKYYCCFVKK